MAILRLYSEKRTKSADKVILNFLKEYFERLEMDVDNKEKSGQMYAEYASQWEILISTCAVNFEGVGDDSATYIDLCRNVSRRNMDVNLTLKSDLAEIFKGVNVPRIVAPVPYVRTFSTELSQDYAETIEENFAPCSSKVAWNGHQQPAWFTNEQI